MARAQARHILVANEEECSKLKLEIAAGADFGEIAKENSLCPSGAYGGDLGEFAPGQMVKEFNDVCFNEAVGVVHGPVKTSFGYHLIEVTERSDD